MIVQIYSIRDGKSDIYGPLFAAHTHGEAERRVRDLLAASESQVARYPEDFDLFHIGAMDNVSGKIELEPTPRHLVKALNLKQLDAVKGMQ